MLGQNTTNECKVAVRKQNLVHLLVSASPNLSRAIHRSVYAAHVECMCFIARLQLELEGS